MYAVQCICDATKALPLIVHALHEKVRTRRREPDLSWVLGQLPREPGLVSSRCLGLGVWLCRRRSSL